jgi:hypothetical protein
MLFFAVRQVNDAFRARVSAIVGFAAFPNCALAYFAFNFFNNKVEPSNVKRFIFAA